MFVSGAIAVRLVVVWMDSEIGHWASHPNVSPSYLPLTYSGLSYWQDHFQFMPTRESTAAMTACAHANWGTQRAKIVLILRVFEHLLLAKLCSILDFHFLQFSSSSPTKKICEL
ncbi:hypothetical protein L596_029761 [Steinernema carpocapsae]|uniref:Uncharacterized protein n=1 Tax=Steinernema carpocapsae TaxID=34508 RepID=A0A4U5LQR8_STECR|nr:hypothetical protein L596_029761 [Steinernema carpocapsae]